MYLGQYTVITGKLYCQDNDMLCYYLLQLNYTSDLLQFAIFASNEIFLLLFSLNYNEMRSYSA